MHTGDNWMVYDVVDAGDVMWNDYKDSDHSYDLDDIWITDESLDGNAAVLEVYMDGELVEEEQADEGETEKAYFGNVSSGEDVYYEVCRVDEGVEEECTTSHFTE